MKRKLFTLIANTVMLIALPCAAMAGKPNVAYTDGNVRFTVITDGTIRMEWSTNGKFTDNSSFVAVNRTYPQVDYNIKTTGNSVEISTSKMELKYKKGSGRFTKDNLKIKSAKGKGKFQFAWTPGTEQKGNLLGTYRTLDGYDGMMSIQSNKQMPIEKGLLATDGWTLIDDSQNFLFDNSEWPWVKTRDDKGCQDWYFMAYGHNYKQALKDYTVFAGKVPLPPRYAFGYWWSRYWSYSDNEFRQLIDNFHAYNIPLDVLVVDMDWHYTDKGRGGWTGYTWNRNLFPDPAGFLKYLKKNNVQITMNLHPADGIASYEENYPNMLKWMGLDSTYKATLPFVCSDKRFMSGWLNTILRPMEKEGVDFWWLDWQQFPYDLKIDKLSNTWWINYVVFSDMERNRDTRPMLYHRWGGLGNHRYQVGFSGDAVISWKSLDFQPYFNSTASNVLYGYWSHDLGGHYGADKIDPEMFTRWMQFGAMSPIMRTHSTKNAGLNKEPWAFDSKYFNVLRNTIMQRYHFAPYIYAMAREDYESGVSLCRPMYYDYPENQEAYDFKNEYMLGDNILVMPITAPMQGDYSTVKVWLPSGNDWYELHTGTLLSGGQTVERSFAIDEYPIYLKAGSVLPMLGDVNNLRSNDESMIITVIPGKCDGQFSMYEDNGNDKNYATQFATTALKAERTGNELTVTIGARTGNYEEMPAERQFTVKVLCSAIPQMVTVNGAKADYSYVGKDLSLLINVPITNCSTEKTVEITYPMAETTLTDGLIGKFRRISNSVLELKKRDAGIVLTDRLGSMESDNLKLTYQPEQFAKTIESFRTNYSNLPVVIKEQGLDEPTQQWFIKSVDWRENEMR
jgi:alpha-glucosidase (family GH31 glycosyl hydrolase)